MTPDSGGASAAGQAQSPAMGRSRSADATAALRSSCSHPSVPPHLGSPGLSCSSCSQPSPFRWLLEVRGTYLQAFSPWKISTNRKFSHFPGWKPNLNIRNACPYFQFFPFSAIPPFLSGNTQLRLSGL